MVAFFVTTDTHFRYFVCPIEDWKLLHHFGFTKRPIFTSLYTYNKVILANGITSEGIFVLELRSYQMTFDDLQQVPGTTTVAHLFKIVEIMLTPGQGT